MTAMSIHIGLNSVDPAHYKGWSGDLRACENDARDMQAIAKARGYAPTLLLTRAATADRILEAIGKAAAALKKGDTLLLTFAGHGTQVPDVNGDEIDKYDETWLAYDRMIIDDELTSMWAKFAAGVRILVISDSCHSGTVTRGVMLEIANRPDLRPRMMPFGLAQEVYLEHQEMYERTQWSVAGRAPVGACVVLISGCLDHQTSMDGPTNGVFTSYLKRAWNNGAFRGSHSEFHRKIVTDMKGKEIQVPNYDNKAGAADTAFEAETPFTTGARIAPIEGGGIRPGRWSFTVEVPDVPQDPGELRRLLLVDACDLMMQAYRQSRSWRPDLTVLARDRDFDGYFVGKCEVHSSGEGKCSAGLEIRF